MLYTIWSACERWGIKPPGVKERFEDCDVMTQARIIEYHRIKEIEEDKRRNDELSIIARIPTMP